MAKQARIKMVVQSPSDRTNSFWFPNGGLAFAAARGIIRDTHCAVTLFGEYGIARFNPDGSGNVAWGDNSTEPGLTTRFCPLTLVCI